MNGTDHASAARSEPLNLTVVASLRVEPAVDSFSESVTRSDGTVYITSYEDSEDITVEVVEVEELKEA